MVVILDAVVRPPASSRVVGHQSARGGPARRPGDTSEAPTCVGPVHPCVFAGPYSARLERLLTLRPGAINDEMRQSGPLTGDGLRFATFYTNLHDRLLRPLARRR